MFVGYPLWTWIVARLNEEERANFNFAISGETVLPRGVIISEPALDPILLSKVKKCIEGYNSYLDKLKR